ncbi:MAG: signal peptidase I [bacterium]|nr:signal peptidase I [bacterium]
MSSVNKKPSDMEKEPQKRSEMKEFINLLLYIVGVIIIALLLNKFVIQKVEVDGPSMNTTLKTGQHLIVEKVTYYFKDPKRSDIVVFTPPGYDDDTLYIKRVIGLPGDKIQIIDGYIYLNGSQYDDKQWMEEILDPGVAEEEITVGEDEYFVVGDNRNDSTDSREFGTIQKSSIMGKAVLRIWPLNKFGTLK